LKFQAIEKPAIIALQWMLKNAVDAKLLCDDSKVDLVLGKSGGGYVKPDSTAQIHESLTGAWYLAEVIPKKHYNWATREEERRLNLCRGRTIPPRSLIRR
jgi:hypothetical protein